MADIQKVTKAAEELAQNSSDVPEKIGAATAAKTLKAKEAELKVAREVEDAALVTQAAEEAQAIEEEQRLFSSPPPTVSEEVDAQVQDKQAFSPEAQQKLDQVVQDNAPQASFDPTFQESDQVAAEPTTAEPVAPPIDEPLTEPTGTVGELAPIAKKNILEIINTKKEVSKNVVQSGLDKLEEIKSVLSPSDYVNLQTGLLSRSPELKKAYIQSGLEELSKRSDFIINDTEGVELKQKYKLYKERQGQLAQQGFNLEEQKLLLEQEGLDVEAIENSEMAKIAKEQQKMISQHAAEVLAIKNKRTQKILTAEKKVEELVERYHNQAEGIDPNRLIKDMGVGEKIVNIVAMAFGGTGAGGTNQVVANFKNAMEKDLQKQMQSLAITGGQISQQKGLLAELRANTSSITALQNQWKQTIFTIAKGKMVELAESSKNPRLKLRAKEIAIKLEEQRNKYAQAANAAIGAEAEQTISNRYGLGKKPILNTKEERERYVPPFGMALDKKRAEKFAENAKNYVDAIHSMSELKKIIEKGFTVEAWFGEDFGKAKVLETKLLAALRIPIVGTGQFSDDERNFIMEMLPRPGAILEFDTAKLAKLEMALKKATMDFEYSMRNTFGRADVARFTSSAKSKEAND